jgi:hypothetical protein
MTCQTRSQLPLDVKQIENCKKCKHISSNLWCCLYGFWIEGKEYIKPELASKRIAKLTLLQMAGDFAKAMLRWGKSGMACVSKDEYILRRSICNECTDSWRCPHCGCMLWAKVALATEKCSLKKW